MVIWIALCGGVLAVVIVIEARRSARRERLVGDAGGFGAEHMRETRSEAFRTNLVLGVVAISLAIALGVGDTGLLVLVGLTLAQMLAYYVRQRAQRSAAEAELSAAGRPA